MKINIKDEGTTVDMSFYIKKLLEGTTVKGQASPGNRSLFIVDKESQLLDKVRENIFTPLRQSCYTWQSTPGRIFSR
jgi:hypothetical protein